MGDLEHVADPAVGTLVGAIKAQFHHDQRMCIACELLADLRPDEKERIGRTLIRQARGDRAEFRREGFLAEIAGSLRDGERAEHPRLANPPAFGGDDS